MAGYRHGGARRLIFGAPTLNWILLADYLILGLLALAHTWWTNTDRTARRPILVLLLGTVAGIVPFVVFAVFFPSLFREDRFLLWGVVPMALIPLTFAYAIVRFRLFDVQVIVRKSLVYAVLTAVVDGDVRARGRRRKRARLDGLVRRRSFRHRPSRSRSASSSSSSSTR